MSAYSFGGSVYSRHVGEHSGIQAAMVLGLRVLHLSGNRKSTNMLGGILSIGGTLKAHPHSGTIPPTKPYLLVVPLPMKLWGPMDIQATTDGLSELEEVRWRVHVQLDSI